MKEVFPRISMDLRAQFGKPVITGTRVPVEVVIGHIAAGMTMEEVAQEYKLGREDILAALKYATKIVGEETIVVKE